MPEATRPKPLPVVTEEDRPYWEGCKQGKLVLQYCNECQQYQFYPRLYRMRCSSNELQWVEVSGHGFIYSYTIIHQNCFQSLIFVIPTSCRISSVCWCACAISLGLCASDPTLIGVRCNMQALASLRTRP